jgi:hypothetical protein
MRHLNEPQNNQLPPPESKLHVHRDEQIQHALSDLKPDQPHAKALVIDREI